MPQDVVEVDISDVAVMSGPPDPARMRDRENMDTAETAQLELSREASGAAPPPVFTADEVRLIHETQAAAAKDPEAYMEACRSEVG